MPNRLGFTRSGCSRSDFARIDRVLGAHVKHYLSVVPVEWPDAQTIPELLAVLSVVQNIDCDLRFRIKCLPNRFDGGWIGIRTLQEATILTERFLW